MLGQLFGYERVLFPIKVCILLLRQTLPALKHGDVNRTTSNHLSQNALGSRVTAFKRRSKVPSRLTGPARLEPQLPENDTSSPVARGVTPPAGVGSLPHAPLVDFYSSTRPQLQCRLLQGKQAVRSWIFTGPPFFVHTVLPTSQPRLVRRHSYMWPYHPSHKITTASFLDCKNYR